MLWEPVSSRRSAVSRRYTAESSVVGGCVADWGFVFGVFSGGGSVCRVLCWGLVVSLLEFSRGRFCWGSLSCRWFWGSVCRLCRGSVVLFSLLGFVLSCSLLGFWLSLLSVVCRLSSLLGFRLLSLLGFASSCSVGILVVTETGILVVVRCWDSPLVSRCEDSRSVLALSAVGSWKW